MEPIAIIAIAAALVAVAVAAAFGRENNVLRKKVVSLGEELTEATSKRKPAKQAAEPTTKSEKSEKSDKADKPAVKVVNDPELERNLEEARDEIKDLKKTIYDLKQSSKDLKQQLSDATSDRVADVPDSDVMFALREEIATLKADNLQLQESLSSAKRSKPAPAPAPEVKREEPKPQPAAAAPASDDGSKLAQLKERYDKELATLQDEVRDLERKLKSTASNIDKQRRRADNNDRAYKITQRQYDAAQERVVLLEKQLRDAGIQPIPLPHVEPARPQPAPAGAAITRKSNLSSTAVLTPAALAAAPGEDIAEVETVELDAPGGRGDEPKDEGRTVSGMRPVSYEELAAPAAEAVPPQVRPRADAKPDLEADESGGHTAVLRPGTLGEMMSNVNKRSLRDQGSGGHTAVLNPSSLGSFLQDEADATDRTTRDEPVEVADAPAAPQIGAPAVDTEKTGKGLFGMPGGLLADEEERDEERSTQFAFPTKMSTESENNGRLGGSAVDGGDSSVDDAWNDIDID